MFWLNKIVEHIGVEPKSKIVNLSFYRMSECSMMLFLSLIVFGIIFSIFARVRLACAHDSGRKDTKNFWDIQIKKQNYAKLTKFLEYRCSLAEFKERRILECANLKKQRASSIITKKT